MKNFTHDRYRYVINKEKGIVIALSTYAGKTVKGVSKLSPEDTWDEELGKKIAALRCDLKVEKKRRKRYAKEYKYWSDIVDNAFSQKFYASMMQDTSDRKIVNINKELSNILKDK